MKGKALRMFIDSRGIILPARIASRRKDKLVFVFHAGDFKAIASLACSATAKIMRRQDGPFFSTEFAFSVLDAIGIKEARTPKMKKKPRRIRR